MIANSFASFSAQSPWAFTTLLAVIVPLVLHLINKSQAKEVKFANIALIAALKPKSMREFRLNEFWLLLLRIFLIVISVLLLANIISTPALISDDEVQVVSTDWLNASNDKQRQQLATSSADKATYLLAPKSERLSVTEILAWPAKDNLAKNSDHKVLTNKEKLEVGSVEVDSVEADRVEANNAEVSKKEHENTLQQLSYFSEMLSAETKVTAFVTDRASQYQLNGTTSAIAIANPIDWQIITIAEHHQQQYDAPINIMIIYDHDRSADIKYFQQALALLKQQTAAKLTFSYWLNDQFDTKTELDTNAELDSKAKLDADTEAGVAAIEAQREQENTVSYQQALQQQPDWLFYLSSKNIDQNIVNAMALGTKLLVDAQNANTNLMLSQMVTIDKDSTNLLQSDATFYQRALPLDVRAQLRSHHINNHVSKSEAVLWRFFQEDGSTRPMLSKFTVQQNKNSSDVYQLYSRFSPSWSDLLVTKQFPLFLKRLLFQDWQQDTLTRQQRLSREQITELVIRPELIVETAAQTQTQTQIQAQAPSNLISQPKIRQKIQQGGYTELLTFLFILLLMVERIVSEFYRPKMFTDKEQFQPDTGVGIGHGDGDNSKAENEVNAGDANVDGDLVQAVTTAKAVK